MNGDIVFSFAFVFRHTSCSHEYALARRCCTFPLVLDGGSSLSLSRLAEHRVDSCSVARGIAEERLPYPLIAMPETRTHVPGRRAGNGHPCRTGWQVILNGRRHRKKEREGTKARKRAGPCQTSCFHERDVR